MFVAVDTFGTTSQGRKAAKAFLALMKATQGSKPWRLQNSGRSVQVGYYRPRLQTPPQNDGTYSAT